MGSRLESNSKSVQKRIASHAFDDEEGEEYGGSKFGGFTDYFRRKKIKLQNLDAELRSQTANNPPIFRGVVANVNGYTQPSLNDLHKLIVSYGGGFLQYLDGKTTATHIIASSLTPKKAIEFRKYRIVKPAWVVDSVKAGKLLPWNDYRVIDEGPGQRVLGFNNGKVVSQTSTSKRGYKEQSDTIWYTKQLQNGGDTSFRSSARSRFLPSQGPPTPDEGEEEDAIEDAPEVTPPTAHRDKAGEDSTLTPPVTSPVAEEDDNWEEDTEVEEEAVEDDEPPMPSLMTQLRQAAAMGTASQELDVSKSFEAALLADNGDIPEQSSSFSTIHVAEQEQQSKKPTEIYDSDDFGDDETLFDHQEGGVPLDQSAGGPSTRKRLRFEDGDGPNKRQKASPETNSMNTESDIGDIIHVRPIVEPKEPPKKSAEMIAEEHNAVLLADPRLRKSTVVDPNFLEQYYRESRLHHLSTWKADLKSQLQAMAAEKTASQKAKVKRTPGMRRYVLHVDFDSFFAAVSLKKHPQYKDKPAVVAHGQGSGSEIASCNYPARKFGIKNGMWMKRAQDLCPELKILRYDFPAYEETSRQFYEAILATDGIVQSVSIDEALIDVSQICFSISGSDGKKLSEGSIYREQAKAEEIAQHLRDDVRARTGCEVSVGIGGNILLAKVALRKAKPAGQYQIKPEEVLDFIGKLEVTDLPGVACNIGSKLEEIGIKFVKDIRDVSKEKLTNTLGPKTGEKLWEYARGIDKAEVGDVVVRKSVSAEVNWGVRFENQEQVDEFIQSLCGELHKRLIKEKVKGKQLTMKIMRRSPDAPLDPPKHLGHGKCDTYNRSMTLGVATNAPDILTKDALSLLKSFGFSPGELRGIGIQMTKLEPLKTGVESSQRRLQFKTTEPKKTVEKPPEPEAEDPIQDDFVTPKKPTAAPDQVSFGAAELNSSSPSRKPLNTLGTQFIIPTQVDPKVLAEFPKDIRAKLAKHVRTPKVSKAAEPPPTAAGPPPSSQIQTRHGTPSSQTSTPAVTPRKPRTPFPLTALPNESQLDPETLAALPPDVREEVLAFYAQSPSKRATQRAQAQLQSILPQSPRKKRLLAAPPARGTTTRKRGRPRGGGGLFRRPISDAGSTLTQANFITTRLNRSDSNDNSAAETSGADEVDQDFLAALPEDIRKEILAEQRRTRLAKRGGLNLNPTTRGPGRPKKLKPGDVLRQGEKYIRPAYTLTLPPRPVRPKFTTQKLSSLPMLREVVGVWVSEFSDEGPYEEDVGALIKYLAKVVIDEKDMNKAVTVVKWLIWVVEERFEVPADGNGHGFSSSSEHLRDQVREKWEKAVEKVKEGVQAAVKERGLGKVEF